MTKLSPPGIKHLIAVGSGKGGVGKTTSAVHLALAFQARGLKVGLFDADIYGPNVPLLLGIRQKREKSQVYAPILRTGSPKAYIKPLTRFGLKIMSIGLLVGENQSINPITDAVGQLVLQTIHDVLWGDLDVLLIDLPPSAGEPQNSLLKRLRFDGIIIVTTPQDMSLLDAGRSLRFFQEGGAPVLGVIENMSYFVCPSCAEKHEVFPRSKRYQNELLNQVNILGQIPLNPAAAQKITKHHPLIKRNAADSYAAEYLAIADRVYSAVKS